MGRGEGKPIGQDAAVRDVRRGSARPNTALDTAPDVSCDRTRHGDIELSRQEGALEKRALSDGTGRSEGVFLIRTPPFIPPQGGN